MKTAKQTEIPLALMASLENFLLGQGPVRRREKDDTSSRPAVNDLSRNIHCKPDIVDAVKYAFEGVTTMLD